MPQWTVFIKTIFILTAVASLTPVVPAWMALLAGMLLALTLGNPYPVLTKKNTTPLLQFSVMGLGAGMNLSVVLHTGLHGFGYTLASIALSIAMGLIIGKLLNVSSNTSFLISVGTAICGGSAIAAVAPVIRAKPAEISISLATVFFLNAVALILFPPLGHWAGMSQSAFGLWSALAIHDTSSVVGASLQYGHEAVEIATTIKLARALWIVPVTLATAWIWQKKEGPTEGIKKPWFILGFLVMAAVFTWVPDIQIIGDGISGISRRLLVLTLFFIGSGLNRRTLESVGARPFIQGTLLWIVVTCVSFSLITAGYL